MKLILEHLKNNREALLKISEAAKIAKHSVNLGTAREGFITNFLQQNLPEYIRYHSGEIFDKKDIRSGQIDIILHPITSPKLSLYNTINVFPSETVLAAIEVKSNLTTGKKSALSKALKSCKKLKHLEISRKQENSKVIIDRQRIPYILFAYSGTTCDTLKKHLKDYCKKQNDNYRILPDLIIVLDQGYYFLKTNAWQYAGVTFDEAYKVVSDKEIVLLAIYEYILKLIEYWFVNPSEHTMPIEEYTKDMHTIFDALFGDS